MKISQNMSRRLLAVLCLLAAVLPQTARLHSQPAPPANRVLQLDGTNSYVELPPNIFDSLTQATVEGWVKWDRLRSTDRFFDFGDRNREMYVRPDGEQLNYMACAADGVRNRIEVAGILHPNEWCHIAAVSGPGGAKLYFNGVLLGTNGYTGSLSALKGQRNYLGKSNYSSNDPTTSGQLDEVRVWNHERTPEQIRENMFNVLSGTEPGLVGLWSFDDGTVKDRSAGKHHGTAPGNPRFVEAALPGSDSLRRVQVAWLSGKVLAPDGGAATNLEVSVRAANRRIAALRTDATGEYHVSIAPGESIELRAARGELGGGLAAAQMNPGEARRLDFALKPTRLAGRVLGPDNKPRPGIQVELLRAGGDQPVITNSVSNARCDFGFSAPLPGQYVLRAMV